MRPISVSYGCVINTVHLKSIKQKIFIIEYKSLFQLNGSSGLRWISPCVWGEFHVGSAVLWTLTVFSPLSGELVHDCLVIDTAVSQDNEDISIWSLCMIVVEIWAGESNVWRAWGPCLRWTHLSLAMFYCIKQVQTNGIRKYIPLSVGGAAKSPCSGRGHSMAVNSVMTAVCLPDSYWEAY